MICHAMSYYVILCHTMSLFIVLQTHPQLGPADLALLGHGCLNLFQNGQEKQDEPPGQQKHQRLLEQRGQSLLHLAVRRWSKSRSPRRPWSCRQHHSSSFCSLTPTITYPFQTSHILTPTVSSLHSALFTLNVSSLVVPTATESRTLAPGNSDDCISSILDNIPGTCSHHSRSQIHDASSCTCIPK